MSNIYNPGHPAFEKLKELISERTKPGNDKDQTDQKIWLEFGEKTAVMFTDLAGFSRGVVEFGVIHFLQIIFESQKLFNNALDKHKGLLIKAEGDSLLVLFKNPSDALHCAIEMQQISLDYNFSKPDAEKILLCVGLGFGECLKIGDVDIFGAEVNAASKLGEDIAKAWEILVTADFKRAVGENCGFAFEEIEIIPPGSRDKAQKLIYKSQQIIERK